MIIVSEARTQVAPFVFDSGKCKDSAYVLDYINQARQLLYPRAKWIGTLETERIQSHFGLLTLPNRYVKAIRASSARHQVGIDTQWHELADNEELGYNCLPKMIDLGDQFASFRDYVVNRVQKNFRIKIVNESRDDTGKEVTIQGTSEDGRQITVTKQLGEGDFGMVITDQWFRYFRLASKPATIGAVKLNIYDPNECCEMLCSVLEPEDQSIRMRRYKVRCKEGQSFLMQLKKRYRPLVNESEFIEFPVDAIIQACIALTARRNSKPAEFVGALNLALESLNAEIRDDKIDTGDRIKRHPCQNTNLFPAVD